MIKIQLICPGKIKEKFYRDAIDEYKKRLQSYCSLTIIEVADEMTPDGCTEHQADLIKEKEGQRILDRISDRDYVIALAIKGKSFDSIGFARHLDQLTTYGQSSITFVIGGSLGLSDSVLQRANEKLSFSDFTFPHQLMRVILLEQIYRSFRIIRKEPYHK